MADRESNHSRVSGPATGGGGRTAAARRGPRGTGSQAEVGRWVLVLGLAAAALVGLWLRGHGLGHAPLAAAETVAAGPIDGLADRVAGLAVELLPLRPSIAPRAAGAALGAGVLLLVAFLLARVAPRERLVPLLGAGLVAVHPTHVTLSRFGDGAGVDAAAVLVLFAVAAVLFLERRSAVARWGAAVAFGLGCAALNTSANPAVEGLTGRAFLAELPALVGAPLALLALPGLPGALTRDVKWLFALLVWAGAPLALVTLFGARPTTAMLVALPALAVLAAEGAGVLWAIARTRATTAIADVAALGALVLVAAATYARVVENTTEPSWAATLLLPHVQGGTDV